VQVLEQAAREVVERAGIALEDVDWVIPHQANLRILQATMRRLGLNPDRLVSTVDQHANTSAASVPLALDWAMRTGRIAEGQRLLLQGVGGGMAWGASLLSVNRAAS
jgi:3-oxoacyl-[acyl-carrier-protein] synthase-3